ncbi:MAG: DUF362 domain-containing protein [candidate division Zixibacteria bacterium]|nr:DUF362 domain-containing protein [candidate division Zixibacteria bacterium]
MNRRAFIKSGASAILLNFLPFGRLLSETGNPTVWEVSGLSLQSISALFDELGGLKELIEKDLSSSTVLIKPNICLPHLPASATTTTPSTVDVLCEYLIKSGVKRVVITDHTLQDSDKFKNIPLYEVAEKYPEVRLILANERRLYSPVQVDGKELKETEVMKIASKADLIINLPTAKHHSATHVSLAIKNLMGMIWDRATFHTNLDLHQAIGDLSTVIRPQINIIDASRVLLNGGPTGPGKIIEDNRLFASTDIVAVDTVVASRYDFAGKRLQPQQIAHLKAAYQNGIGEIDLDKIQINKI